MTADSAADREALDRLVAVRPVLSGIATTESLLGLPRETLLHAGPAFDSPADIPPPVLNAAVMAAMLAGLARDAGAARAGILSGAIRLSPAQDHGVVTPLAYVVCADTPLQIVIDAAGGPARAYAPINDGNRHPARVGQFSEAVFQEMRWAAVAVAERMDAALSEPLDILPLARHGLEQGDDCHGRTNAASHALADAFRTRLRDRLGDAVAGFFDDAGALFLNLWMAATKCMMRGAEGVAGASLVTAAGGNGLTSGIQISGLPGRWFVAPAQPPRGAVGAGLEDRALGAIGDSAVVEALGLGAMALALSPAQAAAFAPFLPPDHAQRMRELPAAEHPAFAGMPIRLGILAARVVSSGRTPVVGLGILDREGEAGRLGGGIYEMPRTPFDAALATLAANR